MNVCCIYSTSNYSSVEKPILSFMRMPFGISFIFTVLKHAGYDTQLLVMTPRSDYRKMLIDYIKTYRPRLFCLSAVTAQYALIQDVARTIRILDPSIYIILGGHHASLNPGTTIQENCFDAICIGEGEAAIVEYAAQIEAKKEPCNINNLWIKNRGTDLIEKNDTSPFLSDLDSFPVVERSMMEKWIADTGRVSTVLVGRGCPNKCTYCSNHALQKLCTGQYTRFRSPENIVSELRLIVERYPSARHVRLVVETLSANLRYTKALCEHLQRFNAELSNPLSFFTNLSPRKAIIDESFFSRLKLAGIDYIGIGLESGSERIRNEVLKRPRYTNEEIFRFCKLANNAGIRIQLNVLIGIPGETFSDFKETIACLRECKPQHISHHIFFPYPGTDLYRVAKEMNLISEEFLNPVSERKLARMDLPGFSKYQIQREFLILHYRVYKGYLPMYKLVVRTLRQLIFMDPRVNFLFKRISKIKFVKYLNEKLSTDPPHHL